MTRTKVPRKKINLQLIKRIFKLQPALLNLTCTYTAVLWYLFIELIRRIVTDGPQEKDVADFWLTVWEQVPCLMFSYIQLYIFSPCTIVFYFYPPKLD